MNRGEPRKCRGKSPLAPAIFKALRSIKNEVQAPAGGFSHPEWMGQTEARHPDNLVARADDRPVPAEAPGKLPIYK
jgi:hypothetical protein